MNKIDVIDTISFELNLIDDILSDDGYDNSYSTTIQAAIVLLDRYKELLSQTSSQEFVEES